MEVWPNSFISSAGGYGASNIIIPAPQARVRTRKVPLAPWQMSKEEQAFRDRILSLPINGHDQIDPAKPFTETEDGKFMVITQECE